MIEFLKTLREDFTDRDYKVSGEGVAMQASPQRTPMGKAQATFYKAFEAAKGDVGRLGASWCTIQITMYAKIGDHSKSEARNFVLAGEGRANEGWTVLPGIFEPNLYRI